VLADILAQCGAEMGKRGEFGGGNDGPLWFLLRNRNSGPISEGPDCLYTEANAMFFSQHTDICCSDATEHVQFFLFFLFGRSFNPCVALGSF